MNLIKWKKNLIMIHLFNIHSFSYNRKLLGNIDFPATLKER